MAIHILQGSKTQTNKVQIQRKKLGAISFTELALYIVGLFLVLGFFSGLSVVSAYGGGSKFDAAILNKITDKQRKNT